MTTLDTTSQPARRSGRHPINIGHLVMGIAFAGIVLIWVLIKSDAVTGDDIRWLLPVPWVLAGVAGLLATTRRKQPAWDGYDQGRRGWVGPDEPSSRLEEPDRPESAYDDLDEKLARAEHETQVRQAPDDPHDPDDPTDPADPADPIDPDDSEENPR